MRAEGRLPKGVKALGQKQPKGQSQTVQTLRAQHPLKYLLHIANLPKSSFYYHHQDRPDPDEADKTLMSKPTGGIKDATDKGALPHLDWNRKSSEVDEQLG